MNRAWLAAALWALPLGLPARAAEPYEIPVIAALTGGGSFLGDAEKQALELAEKLFNRAGGIHGRPVHFTYHDDQSSPQLAVQALNEILAAQPTVILGSSLVASCNAMAPLVKNGPVMYCFSPGVHPPAGSYVYTSSVSTFDYAQALVNFFRASGRTRLALMTSTDATGQDAEKGFDELLARPENKDIKLVAREHFNTNDVSVSAQIERIKAADPQLFIGWSTGSPIATVLRGMVQAGLEAPFATTGGNMTYAQMKQFAGFLPKALYMPSSEWPARGGEGLGLDAKVIAKQKDFYAAFAAAGLAPDEGDVLAWDPATIVVDALRALPAGATAKQLNDYLQHAKGQAGIDGVYDYPAVPQRGVSLADTVVTLWDPATRHWNLVARPGGEPLKK